MRSLPIVCSVLLVCGVFTTNGESAPTTTNVVIDGYTVKKTHNSPATLPLGTTLILVCRISGIPHGLQTNYHWTCPNGPCQQTGYDGRKINNNIIAINITSIRDGGTYKCTVIAEGREDSKQFQLNINGGKVVHSYGRLILNERAITDKLQLQPPNNDSGDGRIECRVSSGGAMFSYHGRTVTTNTSGDVHQIISGSTATVVIRDRAFNNFVNFEGTCAGIYHYLFISNGTLPDVSITGTTSTDSSITVNIGSIPSGIERVIIGYHRLDLGVPVVGEHMNKKPLETFSSLVPGAKYRITAWGLGGGDDRRRSQSPAVREVTTMEQQPSAPGPRHLTITRVFDDGIELNWIPPREPNGDIQHYIIKYITQDGTQQEINTTNNTNYYNLTGLERGQTYNIIGVVAVNSAGGRRGSQPVKSYVHNPTVESTMSPGTSILSPPTSTPTTMTSTPTTMTSMPTDGSNPKPSNTPQNSDFTAPATPGPLLPAIIGVVAAAIIVLILTILLIIVVVILIKHKKRAKNKSSTVHVYNEVLGHSDRVEDTKPDTVYYSAVGEPPGDVNRPIVEDNVGALYDDVDKPMKQLECDQGTFPQDCYDNTVTENSTQQGVKTTGLGPISADYHNSGPNNTTAEHKQELDTQEATDLADAIYTVPDKSKKKNKGKKKNNKEQEMYHTGGPTCDPLSSTEEKEDEPHTDPEQLYTAVDMTKKKKEK